MVGPDVWGEGQGRSKQTAAQAAASEALLRAEAMPE
jgi:dsRNA-specific ribonuclease